MQKNRRFEKRKKPGNKLLLYFILLLCAITIICVVLNKMIYKPVIDNSVTTPNEENWCLTLVNKWNPIMENNNIELAKLSNGENVDKRICPHLQKMFDAAKKDKKYLIVASGYRTEKEQKEIYSKKFDECIADGFSENKAKKETELWVAIPGTSEHQLGLAVDINADGIHSKGASVYNWLKKNAHLYGFINRYPSNKTNITGVSNEPWHYRYVGIKAATYI